MILLTTIFCRRWVSSRSMILRGSTAYRWLTCARTSARNNLAALHAARTCLFGSGQLGDRKWYTDKPGIASRLKTQTQRRQFWLSLIANLAFFNKLNINDLQSLIHSGDPSGMASLSATTPTTVPALRSIAALASPYDLLRIMAPENAAVVESTLR